MLRTGSSYVRAVVLSHQLVCHPPPSLGRITTTNERYGTALRMIDFLKISRENGDCVVLLLVHPGLNILGRYLPPSKVNDLLLADVARTRPSSSHSDIYMAITEGMDLLEEMEAFDIMDLATFMEYVFTSSPRHILMAIRFAIQATHCLEILHR